ncbi:DUF7693 family protein [Pseudomonas plecoglossicida]|uniref:DUF7693 family protein n=1 Tax=Pseudomonas plecoglossicida TaxID=70775 RepID=UPI003D21B8B3
MTVNDCDNVPAAELTAREVCQVFREVVFGRRTMAKAVSPSNDEVNACLVVVDVEGWCITLHNDGEALGHCMQCVSPDGKRWALDSGSRTDPIALLSTWEHQSLVRMLNS